MSLRDLFSLRVDYSKKKQCKTVGLNVVSIFLRLTILNLFTVILPLKKNEELFFEVLLTYKVFTVTYLSRFGLKKNTPGCIQYLLRRHEISIVRSMKFISKIR